MVARQRKWREKEMEMALKEIEDGLGIRKAAKILGFPKAALEGENRRILKAEK